MKKIPLFITLALLVLPVAGYFVYKEFFRKMPVDTWALIPHSSVLVYEPGSCESCVESVKQSPVWEIIKNASFYQKETDSLKSIFKFIAESKYSLVSLHATKKDDFDFVFYCKTKPQSIDPTLDQWKKNKDFRFSEREFNSVKIHEVISGKNVFSWAFIEDIWIGSFTSFLVEDVVRVYESGKSNSFKQNVSKIYQVPGVEKDAGNLYLQFENFSGWLSVFTGRKTSSIVERFGKSSLLDIKANTNSIILNGFSSDSANRSDYFLSLFADQSPVPFNFKHLISQRTLFLTSYGVRDGAALEKKLRSSKLRSVSYNDTLKQLATSLQFDPQKLYNSLQGEVTLCFTESKGNDLSKVLLIGSNNTKAWLDAFNVISNKTSVDTIFYEKYSGYEIRELPVFRFPEKLFNPLISGFDKSYYTTVSNAAILVSDNLEALKNFLDDIDRDETWGKSVDKNRFLESTLLESNVSFFVNPQRIWNFLSGIAIDKWKTFISENEDLLGTLDMGAIQFSHLNQGFYTNVTVAFHPRGSSKTNRENSQRKIVTNLEANISKISIVKNHFDKTDEIFLQDSTHTIYLISSGGKVLWSKPMDDAIEGDINQIDFFGNGKLQYFFFCGGKFHVIDRLGNYVKPYPVTVPVKEIEFVSVVDYDHSKKYRFLVAGKNGALWMFDKEGGALDGWKPKKVDDELFIAPRHHRLRGKDYILAARMDGNIFLMNRRGEIFKNFPVNINGKPIGDYAIEQGDGRSNTFFIFVTKDGFRVKLNLEGKIISRETLLKTSADAQFALIPERNNKSYLIKRQEPKQLILTDENGKQILQNDFVGMDPVTINYVDFGGGSIIVTITDMAQNLSFVYNKAGKLLTTPPVESDAIQVGADDAPVKIFSFYQKALSVQTLP